VAHCTPNRAAFRRLLNLTSGVAATEKKRILVWENVKAHWLMALPFFKWPIVAVEPFLTVRTFLQTAQKLIVRGQGSDHAMNRLFSP
jgi:hypothetical protein